MSPSPTPTRTQLRRRVLSRGAARRRSWGARPTSAPPAISPPLTGRRVTLSYLRVTASGTRISAPLVDIHKDEAAVLNGFTAPNVCLAVYSSFQCVLPGPELFSFDRAAKLSLRIAGRRMTGTLTGTGTGYTQVLPYPTVRYSGRLSAGRR